MIVNSKQLLNLFKFHNFGLYSSILCIIFLICEKFISKCAAVPTDQVTVVYPKVQYYVLVIIIQDKISSIYTTKYKNRSFDQQQFWILGSTLCLNVDWCRIVNCIILTPLHIPILLLNCIHGPNEDGSAWLDVNCCCDNCCPSCLQPVDAPSYSDSPSEHSPLITSVCTHWS